MAPATDDEIQCSGYCLARRTVTDNHVQKLYPSPLHPILESLVQSEAEYHTVKKRHADPCDNVNCPAALLHPIENPMQKLTSTPNTTVNSITSGDEPHAGSTTYLDDGINCEHPTKRDKTGVTPPPLWWPARMAPFRKN